MRHFIALFIAVFAFGGISAQNVDIGTLDDILEQFDAVYRNRERSLQVRLHSIDSLRSHMARLTPKQKILYCDRLGEAYRMVRVDSAAAWFERGAVMAEGQGDMAKAQYFTLKKLGVWPELGLVRMSEAEFDQVTAHGVYDINKETYYEEGARMFAYIAWCTSFVNAYDRYNKRSNELSDSLRVLLEDKDISTYKLHNMLHAYHSGNKPELIKSVNNIMATLSMSDPVYAAATTVLGVYYKDHDEMENAAKYLCLGAISDMSAGRLESAAMEELVDVFYKLGDVSRASGSVVASLRNANSSGANRRILQVIQSVPDVLDASAQRTERTITALRVVVACLMAALMAMAVSIVKRRKQMRKLCLVKDQLAHANYMKDAYINRFMGLCSMYMQKTGDFMRLATRKINAGQYEELYAYIRSGKLLEDQTQLFYDNFDDVFVKIFPTFVDDVNKLLLPDKQIVLPENAVLNTELRILAFSRLGIDDGATIARFLDLSLNTIYTYRAKLRNRAKNRETFDRDVMEIGRIG